MEEKIGLATHARGGWKPIDTAPPDTHIEMGKWDLLGGMNWRTTTGYASRTKRGFFRSWIEETFYGEEYTHWRPLPPPPNDSEG